MKAVTTALSAQRSKCTFDNFIYHTEHRSCTHGRKILILVETHHVMFPVAS